MGRGGIGAKAASSSSIEITFVINGARCRERLQLKPTPSNLKLAAKHKGAIDVAIVNGTFDYAHTFPNSKNRHRFKTTTARRTVSAYLSDYLDASKPHLSTSTWDDYRKTIENVYANSSLAEVTLADLDRPQIKAFCENEMASVTNKRIANVLSVLRTALTAAVQNTDIETNILEGYSYTRKEAPKADEEEYADPLPAAEQAQLLACMQPKYSSHFKFAIWTGCRPSEQVAVLWSDINFLKGVISVNKARTRKAVKAEKTKTKSGRRRIKMLAPAREALLEQYERATSVGPPNPRVWDITNDGAAWTIWTLAEKKAGLHHRNPYQSRHTYASMLLSAGEPEIWVASQMGHSDLGLIRRRYGRWIEGCDEYLGDAAVAMFAPPALMLSPLALALSETDEPA